MDDQFEKDLKKRISEVFDNYEDTTADEGWQQLRQKFPEDAKKRPVAWWWWSSAAAVLLVLLGILWLKQTPDKEQQFTAVKKHGSIVQPKTPTTQNTQKPGDSNAVAQFEETLANVASNKQAVKRVDSSRSITQIIDKRNGFTIARVRGTRREPVDNTIGTISTRANKPDQNAANSMNSAATAATKTDDNTIANNITASTVAAAKPDSAGRRAPGSDAAASAGSELQKSSKPNNAVLAYNNVPSKQKRLPGDRRVRFGVYAATFFNYAKGSNSQLNMGAGISSDIRLTKKLMLSTGIAIAQNSLSYGGQPMTPVPQGITLAPLALYSANTLRYSMSEPAFKSYNANLVGIDIPVNLKYTFDPGKTETYLLAGLSSGTFLNERYTYNFNGAILQNQFAKNGSGGFYFGRMLNLAIGSSYRFGGSRLIIEPFLKYPLDGMGAQQIHFGSGGLNLKFSIPSMRK